MLVMRGLQTSPDGHAWTRSALAAACALKGFPVQPWPCFWPLLWPYSSAKGPSNAFLHQEPWLEEGRWASARPGAAGCVPGTSSAPFSRPQVLPGQDGAAGAPSTATPLGPRVPLPAPLAVGTVHSLSQQAQRGPARRPVMVMPVETSHLRQTYLCSLSKSDIRPHELHRGKHHSTAPRPASMDLHPLWLEMSRGGTRLQAAAPTFLPQQLPRAPPATTAAIEPSTGPEDTYSNVGLATVPRARLAVSPVLWGETQLMSCAQLGSRASSTVAQHACIPKSKGPQELHGGAGVTPAAQVKQILVGWGGWDPWGLGSGSS
ncbi:lck-interacting transmembrane adapter 1 isoform X2 [Dipodomys spectabilis]|uniref:lck-interacting transmembrane adapter 1 isoform X2 n=1 Tax=Dipodomys spectabilis TaxID=105255 RepID=UPI001C5448FF|nr:lck-interacting transmembrane adapter 1 isoform X2 [Dipodomys spectabilis]